MFQARVNVCYSIVTRECIYGSAHCCVWKKTVQADHCGEVEIPNHISRPAHSRRWAYVLLLFLLCAFYHAMLCIRGTSHGPVSVCLSVRPSQVGVLLKRLNVKTTPRDSLGTIVFGCQRSPRNSTGITPCGAPNTGGVGQNRRLSTNSWLYLENGTR